MTALDAARRHQVASATTTVLHGVDLRRARARADRHPRARPAAARPRCCASSPASIDPDAGTIAFGDRDGRPAPAGRVPPQRRRVGYVPQEGALFPHLDVAANITFGLPRGGPPPGHRRRRAARAGRAAVAAARPAARTSSPAASSSGSRSPGRWRPRPRIVLLDEPFSSLDAGLREGTGRAVADALRAAGATAVLVTHDQAEALSLADQVAVMRDGRLAQVGTPKQVYRRAGRPGRRPFVGGAVVLPAVVSGTGATSVLGGSAWPTAPPRGRSRCWCGPSRSSSRRPPRGRARTRPPAPYRSCPVRAGPTATVREVSYFGHDCAVRLQLAGTGEQVTARMVGEDAPEPGAVVALSVRGPVNVFAAAPAGGSSDAAALAPASAAG